MIDFDPARHAERVFSRSPPILRNFPMTVSSPVVVIVSSRDFFRADINIEVAIVIPAEGPSGQ